MATNTATEKTMPDQSAKKMEASFLIDTTKCIGCRGCQVACKQWNGNQTDPTKASPTFTNPLKLNSKTYTNIAFFEREQNGAVSWDFARNGCFHCKKPACVSVCPVEALVKTPEGPVIYREGRCMGCRYCMLACPFNVPKYEWEKLAPKVQKCTFCYDRLRAGMIPACAKSCPTGTIHFSDSIEKNLAEAKKRIAEHPGQYVNHIYGEKEAGGTSVLLLSALPPGQVGHLKVGDQVLPDLTWKYIGGIPAIIGVVLAAGIGSWVITRRNQNMDKEGDE
ncbi:MAG: 4Fe-4S dicluster domain-containing protein [Nitrospirota bacterium]|nr:4Fe-4S dicluster domain-containing protein [Nitrospirota bacterium]